MNHDQTEKDHTSHENHQDTSLQMNHDEKLTDYLQFAGIILAVFVASLALAYFFTDLSLYNWMRVFMGSFFVTFAGFKLFNLGDFVTAFKRYDILAGRSDFYAKAYPFIELTLGVLYLGNIAPLAVNSFTVVLMLVSSVGVIKTLVKQDTIMCACLGTVIKLPVTKVTLVEDLGMGIMAAAMVLMLLA